MKRFPSQHSNLRKLPVVISVVAVLAIGGVAAAYHVHASGKLVASDLGQSIAPAKTELPQFALAGIKGTYPQAETYPNPAIFIQPKYQLFTPTDVNNIPGYTFLSTDDELSELSGKLEPKNATNGQPACSLQYDIIDPEYNQLADKLPLNDSLSMATKHFVASQLMQAITADSSNAHRVPDLVLSGGHELYGRYALETWQATDDTYGIRTTTDTSVILSPSKTAGSYVAYYIQTKCDNMSGGSIPAKDLSAIDKIASEFTIGVPATATSIPYPYGNAPLSSPYEQASPFIGDNGSSQVQ